MLSLFSWFLHLSLPGVTQQTWPSDWKTNYCLCAWNDSYDSLAEIGRQECCRLNKFAEHRSRNYTNRSPSFAIVLFHTSPLLLTFSFFFPLVAASALIFHLSCWRVSFFLCWPFLRLPTWQHPSLSLALFISSYSLPLCHHVVLVVSHPVTFSHSLPLSLSFYILCCHSLFHCSSLSLSFPSPSLHKALSS